ncbi:MAG: KH domain-containing protein [Anaerolineae bacterium]|nr:KH domain-containing protein [Anaerolineae bacterium]
MLKELVEYMVRGLVDHPERVRVTERETPRAIIVRLKVAPDDMGRVIGKDGRVANAMRTLLRVTSAKHGKQTDLRIG